MKDDDDQLVTIMKNKQKSFLEKNKVFLPSITISIGFFLSLATAISAGLILSKSCRSAKTPTETACVNTALRIAIYLLPTKILRSKQIF